MWTNDTDSVGSDHESHSESRPIHCGETVGNDKMNESTPNIYACDEVREIKRLHQDLFNDEFRQLSIREQLNLQAQRIHEAHQSGDEAVVTHIQCWHPELVGWPITDIMAYDLTLEDARNTIAREYGFADWSDAELKGAEPSNPDFEAAVDAIVNGDVDGLRALLERKPSLIHERSNFGHRSTLLHYVGSNGVETYRQVVPRNLAEITKILINAGADVNATAEMYGGGSTTIALLITSSHPVDAGITDEVVKVLVDAGAETDKS